MILKRLFVFMAVAVNVLCASAQDMDTPVT